LDTSRFLNVPGNTPFSARGEVRERGVRGERGERRERGERERGERGEYMHYCCFSINWIGH
jgi:hypothetical protein